MKIRHNVTADHVRAEAQRRIEAQWPLWRQMNTLRADTASIEAMGAEIDAIRAASNALEASSPIPADFTSDKHWP